MLRTMLMMLCIGILVLTGCQHTPTSDQVIAKTFNHATQIQQKLLDRHAPAGVLIHSNVMYLSEPKLTFDLYQPEYIAELGARPTVVWIHGGGWVSGSKEHARGYFKLLAAQGFNVVSVEYQFAPEVQYPEQLLQINQALKFIDEHAETYHIDTNQLYLAGDSAGANLASHYAALLTNQDFARQSAFVPTIQMQQLKGLILHCGIYDMASFVLTAPDEHKIIEWGIYSLVQAYIGERKNDAAFLTEISPSQHLTHNFPPVLISGGNKDFLTESQSIPFVQALKQQNVPVTAVFYPESTEPLIHEYQFFMRLNASQETFAQTLQFIHFYSGLRL
ncbi:alpha/beta hydrolase [Acinetobacter sp. GXMZU3951]